jgi:hypothetical protein
MFRVELADTPLAMQVTVTGQDPVVVEGPIVQVHETAPDESAVLALRPVALDIPDLYLTAIVQAAFALVLTPTVASELRGAGEVKVVKVTLIFGGAAVGAAVFTGVAVGAAVFTGVAWAVGTGVGARVGVGAGEGVAEAEGEGPIVAAAVGVLEASAGMD